MQEMGNAGVAWSDCMEERTRVVEKGKGSMAVVEKGVGSTKNGLIIPIFFLTLLGRINPNI